MGILWTHKATLVDALNSTVRRTINCSAVPGIPTGTVDYFSWAGYETFRGDGEYDLIIKTDRSTYNSLVAFFLTQRIRNRVSPSTPQLGQILLERRNDIPADEDPLGGIPAAGFYRNSDPQLGRVADERPFIYARAHHLIYSYLYFHIKNNLL